MAELLLVNPSHRNKRRAKARRANPRKKHHKRRHAVGYLIGDAPVRRRKMNPHKRRHKRPSHYTFRRRRSNPSFRELTGSIKPTVKAGAVGALGALGLDLLWGYSSKYLPASINTGYAAFAAKALASILVGMVGSKVMRGSGRDLAVGGMTVVLHDLAKQQLASAMPSLPLGMYTPMGAYLGIATNAGGMRQQIGVPNFSTGLGSLDLTAHNTPGDYNDGIY
jgi:hypothetical protein